MFHLHLPAESPLEFSVPVESPLVMSEQDRRAVAERSMKGQPTESGATRALPVHSDQENLAMLGRTGQKGRQKESRVAAARLAQPWESLAVPSARAAWDRCRQPG